MAHVTSWLAFGGVISVVFLFSTREVILYRRDQTTRADIYPYTKARLRRRLWVSLLLGAEAWLLLVGRHTVRPDLPVWLVIYLSLIVLLALGLGTLAFLDFRESRKLLVKSEERLLQELMQEIQHDKNLDTRH